MSLGVDSARNYDKSICMTCWDAEEAAMQLGFHRLGLDSFRLDWFGVFWTCLLRIALASWIWDCFALLWFGSLWIRLVCVGLVRIGLAWSGLDWFGLVFN